MKNALIIILFAIGLTSTAFASECEMSVEVGDNMNFPQSMTISKSACPTLTLTITHTGKIPRNAMGHNWVLTTTADAQAVSQAGWSAGLDSQYLPTGDTRVLAATKIVGGGESDTISFDTSALEVDGDYTYFCSFVGHFAMMKGKFNVAE
ncbi:MAG: azurin [Pseudomonadota bacterium]